MNWGECKVSIIVTCYNLDRYVNDCIGSLLNQECGFNYEIIIVNDCSTDGSFAKIAAYTSSKIILINNASNMGAAQSVSEALKICKGEYICRFDADDVWPPDFLKKTAHVLDSSEDISMVYGDLSIIDENGVLLKNDNNINRRDKHKPVIENEFVDILREYYINAPTIMFRKQAFLKAFPLPALIIEKKNFIDWYISLVVLQHGKAYFINEPLAYYRIHTANMHRQVVANKTGETVTNFILTEFVENNPALSGQMKREILSDNFFMLGEKYFGVNMLKEARVNYLKAFKNNVHFLLNKKFVRHFVASFMGNNMYSSIKKAFKKLLP